MQTNQANENLEEENEIKDENLKGTQKTEQPSSVEETQELNDEEGIEGEEKFDTDDKDRKFKDLEDKLLRTYAEYDNFRKRTQKEKEVMFSDGQMAAITEFLPVLDNLERALKVKVENEEAQKLVQGIEMVVNQFKDALVKLNITPIETDNQEFDPERHNAVMHIDDENYGQNMIVEELMKGYLYKDRVIRHSMVKVAN